MVIKQISKVSTLGVRGSLSWLNGLLVLGWLLSFSSVQAEDSPYLLQSGDILQISVWKEADLQGEVLVRPDGGISFPLVGDLQVQGLSIAQTIELISKKIEKYIPDPMVSVATKQLGGNLIYVIGKVNRAGEFTFNRPVDVMQALSLAGGTTTYADLSDIRILRRVDGKQTAIRFDYSDVEKGKALNTNILLHSGDVVVVP